MQAVNLYFLVLPGTMLMDLAGVAEPFRVARKFGGEFRLHFIGPKATPKAYLGLTLNGVGELPRALPDGAYLFAPGIAMAAAGLAQPQTAQVVSWLRQVVRTEVTLCTICSGAFLAARAGLLDGRQCTTHHTFVDQLKSESPWARVVENRIFVRDGNVYSSAGIAAGVDLALHLMSETAGPLVALEVAKFLVLQSRRLGADPQLSPWLVHRSHVHPRIHKVQDLIIRDPVAPWTVATLAEQVHTSPRNLTRLFKLHAGVPPLTYLRQIRTASAKKLIATRELSSTRIAEMAGFSSPEQMRRAMRKFDANRTTQ